jgi:uncharacterized alkaline shock family protein YloU
MVLSSTVVETIVALAVKNVEGVVGLSGSDQTAGPIARLFASASKEAVDVDVSEDEKLIISVRIEVEFGYVLPEVADKVRAAVADAIEVQVNAPIERIDVYVDAIRFD